MADITGEKTIEFTSTPISYKGYALGQTGAQLAEIINHAATVSSTGLISNGYGITNEGKLKINNGTPSSASSYSTGVQYLVLADENGVFHTRKIQFGTADINSTIANAMNQGDVYIYMAPYTVG